MNYSENNEQEIIGHFFKDELGNFLDVGAYDGVNFSNTLALLEKGWKGTLVEPSPGVFESLCLNMEMRGFKDKVQLHNTALVPDYFKRDAVFYEELNPGNPAVQLGSSFSHGHVLDRQARYKTMLNPIQPKLSSVSSFLQMFGYDYKFINIDVEDLNFELVLGIDWKRFEKLELLCVEQDVLSVDKYTQFFSHFDFKLYEVEKHNLFFVKDSAAL